MNKVKVFMDMIAVALGGLIIWSCTQDEMENGKATFRYSAEEIATLRAMAEKYGVPNIKFITSSQFPLPSMKEMEQNFIEFAVIKQVVAQPLEVVDSTATSKIYKTKQMPRTRVLKRVPEMSTDGIDLSQFVAAVGTSFWLTLKVTVTKDKNDPNKDPTVSVYGSLKLPYDTYDTSYGKSGETTSTRWISKDRIGVSYSCNVTKYEIKRTQFGEEIKIELASDNVTVDTSTAI